MNYNTTLKRPQSKFLSRLILLARRAGRAHFADQLTSIRYCVQETCNFDAIFAYLTCGNVSFFIECRLYAQLSCVPY